MVFRLISVIVGLFLVIISLHREKDKLDIWKFDSWNFSSVLMMASGIVVIFASI